MNANRGLKWPTEYEPRNKKFELRNALIALFKERRLGWGYHNVDSHGKPFISYLGDVLWYLDGHWHKFAGRSKPLPPLFESFQGFNLPETHKKKKAEKRSLDRVTLLQHAQWLNDVLQQPWVHSSSWSEVRLAVEVLADSVRDYADYLRQKCEEVQANHQLLHPKRQESGSDTKFDIIVGVSGAKPKLVERYKPLVSKLLSSNLYEPILVNDFLPMDTRERRCYIDQLSNGIPLPLQLFKFTYSSGNNLGNTHFLWKISDEMDSDKQLEKNYHIVDHKSDIKVYHSRAMRNDFKAICGRVSNMKPAIARELYRRYVGDASAAETGSEALIDQRVQAFLDCEDEDIIWDLREKNAGRPEKYSVFFEFCQKYLNSQAEVAVDDRRHDSIMHMAVSMSAPVLLREITKICPPDTPIPSVKWLSLQFWPKDPTKRSAMQYTGRFRVKYMIQSRQFRASHPDCHYASALFRFPAHICSSLFSLFKLCIYR